MQKKFYLTAVKFCHFNYFCLPFLFCIIIIISIFTIIFIIIVIISGFLDVTVIDFIPHKVYGEQLNLVLWSSVIPFYTVDDWRGRNEVEEKNRYRRWGKERENGLEKVKFEE